MKIGRLLPGFIKDHLTRALSAVLNYVVVDFLRDYVHRRKGIGDASTEEITGETFLIEHVLPRLLDKEHPVMFDEGANVGHQCTAHYIGTLTAVPRVFPRLMFLKLTPKTMN